ncbi:MAG: hypothetical protein AAFX06_33220 [Planctomycetota bacterium]
MFVLIGQTDVSPWAQFGLAGLVIAALFGVLGLIVKWAVGHITSQATTHREERAEWRASDERRQTEFCDALKDANCAFAETVKEISKQ